MKQKLYEAITSKTKIIVTVEVNNLIFTFHAVKNLTCAEGGALVFSNNNAVRALRLAFVDTILYCLRILRYHLSERILYSYRHVAAYTEFRKKDMQINTLDNTQR